MGYYVGLDLGQSRDYTALAIVERVVPPPVEVVEWSGRVKHVPSKEPAALHVRHLERFALGTRYPKIVEAVGGRLHALNVWDERPTLVVDKTGVGAPVVDLFIAAGFEPMAITITAGNTVTHEGRDYFVPKRDLVSVVQATLQTGRLRFAEGLPELSTLQRELLSFQAKITIAANDVYGAWREGQHDDVVLAVALATWFAEKGPRWEPMDPELAERWLNYLGG